MVQKILFEARENQLDCCSAMLEMRYRSYDDDHQYRTHGECGKKQGRFFQVVPHARSGLCGHSFSYSSNKRVSDFAKRNLEQSVLSLKDTHAHGARGLSQGIFIELFVLHMNMYRKIDVRYPGIAIGRGE